MQCKDMAEYVKQNELRWIGQAYERWLDEREYEDINEYLRVFKERVPDAIAVHKRPFGFTIKCDDGLVIIEVRSKGASIVLEIIIETQRVGSGTIEGTVKK
jgi:hypothetical protein